ncbi:MAG: hypothetical protein M1826_005209 [Phylliscum demangeonii]|nr:MAG: hypothetical protein M1826_005209 [Phylliscum demangeonii]
MHVSDELNGKNRHLRQPYDPNAAITEQVATVRTLAPRRFPSMWSAAMFENAVSRVFLGVHCTGASTPSPPPMSSYRRPSRTCSNYMVNPDGTSAYNDPAQIRYLPHDGLAHRPPWPPVSGKPQADPD